MSETLHDELARISTALGPEPWRRPDATDRVLAAIAAKMRHERRMQEIREMDIEAWAREQAGGRDA